MIRWAYAINQWKPQFDDFTRRRDHERALRVVSVAGFSGIELTAGIGRWEPLGNPEQLAANFATIEGLRRTYETELEAILQEGKASGAFSLSDTKLATLAFIAMLTGPTNWFREGGRLSRAEIEDIYAQMVLNAAGA